MIAAIIIGTAAVLLGYWAGKKKDAERLTALEQWIKDGKTNE